MEGSLLAWTLGGTMVVAHSLLRFNTPETVRGSTTVWRYWTFISVYVMTMALAWAAFALVPGLPGVSDDLSKKLTGLQPAVASALALTLFLSDMPWIRPIEAAWRTWLHSWAGMPNEAHLLAERLHTSALVLSDTTGPLVRAKLVDALALLDHDDFTLRLEPELHPATQLIRLATIHRQLAEWKDQDRLSTFPPVQIL